ncbi:MAG: S8 family peptidase [Bacteroidota bacterium]
MNDKKYPHLLFKNPSKGLKEYKQRQGGGNDDKKPEEEKNYRPMATHLSTCLVEFDNDQQLRYSQRNNNLGIHTHIDAIEIEFFGPFNRHDFETYYINQFGIAIVSLTDFNRTGYFLIVDRLQFNHFQEQINQFINNALNNINKEYDKKINFIKSFIFHTSGRINKAHNKTKVVYLNLFHADLFDKQFIKPIKESLRIYLQKNNLKFIETEFYFEVENTDTHTINEIAQNFDILQSISTHLSGLVKPTTFGLADKSHGFIISNSEDNLPIIGIIDTGISKECPLNPIIVNDSNSDFDATGTGALVDDVDHGTGVATLAALGRKLYPGHIGSFEADAKVLSIKITNQDRNADIKQSDVIELIKKAYKDKSVRIFCLTIGYQDFLDDNQHPSTYAFELDKLAYEHDLLICISTTNNGFINDNSTYPEAFRELEANISSPAESFNNITVGAISDNWEVGSNLRRSPDKEFPAIYSKKFHYDMETLTQTIRNSRLRKPDILLQGGDYTENSTDFGLFFDSDQENAMKFLSTKLGDFYTRTVGTSLSAPIAANLAARITRLYPDLKMQTVKALIVNSADFNEDLFAQGIFNSAQKQRVIGWGIPIDALCLNSRDKNVTLIIEDSINCGNVKSFPLNIPSYFSNAIKKNKILDISATLCFSFMPDYSNQLSYCPVHVNFIITKDVILEKNVRGTIYGKGGTELKINSAHPGWSQDYYYKGKLFSNCQKMEFTLKKSDLIAEDFSLQIAIGSTVHKMLGQGDSNRYQGKPINYSLVITLKEYDDKAIAGYSLYDELFAINALEILGEAELSLDL